jgi:dihydrolipoamide dehydrogenase
MSEISKDLIVLGSGPGGYTAAIRASQLGRKVTLVERESLGGICLNWGCIPTKALLKTAQVFSEMQHAESFGIEVSKPKPVFDKIISRSRDVASKLSGGVAYLMKKNKIEVINGNGKLVKGNKLVVTDKAGASQTLTFKDVIIATGARARTIPGVEVDGKVIHIYRSILENKIQPKKLLVIGAGAIGVEFAYFFHTLGVDVTLVEMLDRVLPVEDHEVSDTLLKIFAKRGLKVKTSTAVVNLFKTGTTVSADLKAKEGSVEKWSGDSCLIAIGVTGNIENIGLEEVGVKFERGAIDVDGFMRTNVANHYAIGDVAGGPWLAHVASHEGIVAAEAACGVAEHPMHYDNIPGCTYCQPQVASVGLTEQAAKEKGLNYKVGKMPFAAIGKAIAIGDSEGFVKSIIDADSGEVYGVHIIHGEATELISEAAIIRSHEGIAKSVLDTIHPHPTLAESIMESMAVALGRPLNS